MFFTRYNYAPKTEQPQSTQEDNCTLPGQSLPLHQIIREAVNGNAVQQVSLRYGSDLGDVDFDSIPLSHLQDRHLTATGIDAILDSYAAPAPPSAKQEPSPTIETPPQEAPAPSTEAAD